MEKLDGDDGVLRDDSGRAVERDIVQFVCFNDAVKRGDLAEQVLKEIPNQLCGYMERNGIVPQFVVANAPAIL